MRGQYGCQCINRHCDTGGLLRAVHVHCYGCWDRDLGAGSVILPDPKIFNGGGIQRLAIAVGKNGIAYVMNADNLGGYKLSVGGTDGIIQTVPMPDNISIY